MEQEVYNTFIKEIKTTKYFSIIINYYIKFIIN